jgi:hypothetical protein
MIRRGILGVLAIGGGLLAAHSALAEEPSSCLRFFDPATRDGAEDVFVSVEKLDEKHACFLVPRALIEKRYRAIYSDRMPLMEMLTFEPADLIAYVSGKSDVMVGSEQRAIGPDLTDCPADPMPRFLFIASQTVAAPSTVREAQSYAKEAASDVPGYQRYTTMIADLYLDDPRPEALVSFECLKSGGLGCVAKEDYDGMTLVLVYPKSDISKVKLQKARQCLRGIAQLFRITKPVQAN